MVVGTNYNYKAQKARKLNIFVLVLIVYAVIVHPYITHLADDNFFDDFLFQYQLEIYVHIVQGGQDGFALF